MSKSKKWLVKNEWGVVKGPFTTVEVIERIRSGRLTGDESISLYPGDKWVLMSQEIEFYDHLLEVLEESNVDSEDPSAPFEGITNPTFSKDIYEELHTDSKKSEDVNQNKSQENIKIDFDKIESNSEKKNQQTLKSNNESNNKNVSSNPDIVLKKSKNIIRSKKVKKSLLPLILAVAVAIIGLFLIVFFPNENKKNDGKINLIPLSNKTIKLTQKEVDKKFKLATSYYSQDSFSFYFKAQKELVSILSNNPRHKASLEALCMNYFELWPFAKQDSKDLRALSMVYQQASKVDPFSHAGFTCKIIYYFLNGNYESARSHIENGLDHFSKSNSAPIALYYLKAKVLENKKDSLTAISYANSAQRLWPQWIAPYFLEARLYYNSEKMDKAVRKLKQILKARPNHVKSKILLGIIEAKGFRHYQKAKVLIKEATNYKSEVPPTLLSLGYQILAEIEFQAKNKSEALKYAIQSYKINPGNKLSENLIRSLGGKKKLPKAVRDQQLMLEGEQFVREGDFLSAQAHFMSAYEINPKNAMAAFKAAQSMWELNLSSDAIKMLHKSIQADAKFIEAYSLLVDFYTQRYDFDSASKILEKIGRVFPKSYQVLRSYALVELRRKNYKGALNYAKRASEIYEMDIETQVIYANAAFGMGNYELAFDQAQKAIEINENNAEAHHIFARILTKREGVDVAFSYMKKKVKEYPLNLNFRYTLGELYLEEDQFEAAREVLEQVAELQEKPKKALLLLGQVYKMVGELERSKDAFLRAAVIDPSDPEPYFEAGKLYLQTQKYNEALDRFQSVLEVNELFPRIHYYIGKTFLNMGSKENLKQALKYADLEQKKNPNLVESYILSAEVYYKLKQFNMCTREYQKAIRFASNDSELYIKMARCYRLQGSLDIAKSMLDRAAKIESGNAQIYKEYGAIYELQGDIEGAIRFYQDYFRLEPNAADKFEIMQRLQNL